MVSKTFKYCSKVQKTVVIFTQIGKNYVTMKDKEKSKVRRHFSYNLLSAAVGTLSSSGGDGIWEEIDVSLTIERLILKFKFCLYTY